MHKYTHDENITPSPALGAKILKVTFRVVKDFKPSCFFCEKNEALAPRVFGLFGVEVNYCINIEIG